MSRRQFQPGHSGNAATMWQPGQSGNPAGSKSKLQRQFEASLYSHLCDDETAKEAVTALKAAIKAGQPWAIQLYFSKVLPGQPISVRLSRDEENDGIDYSRLDEEEFEQLGRLLGKAAGSGEERLGIGQGETQSPSVHPDGVAACRAE